MAIDRIGKGGGLPPTPDVSGTGAGTGGASVEKTGAKFEVERTKGASEANAAGEAHAASNVEGASGPSALSRLRAGEVDVHGYVDLKVDEATSALKGLSKAELDEIKSVLRDQMRSDPGLAELVRTATGKLPAPPEE